MTEPTKLIDQTLRLDPTATPDDDEARRLRVERLAARRPARVASEAPTVASTPMTSSPHVRPSAPRARHAAAGGRVAAAGFGVAALFGLVGVMGMARRSTTASTAAPAAAPPAQVLVVIQHDGISTPVTGGQVVIPAAVQTVGGVQTASNVSPPASAAAGATAAPIALTARPVIRQAPAAAAVARTNGSR